ncbi:MAG: xanthine dehydrogenase family protein subunit M [Firmicutes bacterium]|jgi:carbon-monoxide dehydrogenase medium subunit|nr:xanthine dehydrogenase family protein subunit M [Bacillota bacterium]MDH7495231.1 xanthine dehydrogenase family protein subunit M [Bacillota bacterium]
MRERLPRFRYMEARSVEEALSLLKELGPGAKLLAGGTDLLVAMRMKGARPDALVNLKTVPGLDTIEARADGLFIGALATMQAVADSPEVARGFGCLARAAGVVGSWQVRNRATVGGNLCNGAPSAETAPPLLVLGAKAHVAEPGGGAKVVDLDDFFLGPGVTLCSSGRLLLGIAVPEPPQDMWTTYIKHSPRRAMDIAVVGVAVGLALKDGGRVREARIALGAVAPTPFRAREAEAYLEDRILTSEAAREAGRLAARAARPISDVRASAGYRLEMCETLVARALTALASCGRDGRG